MNDLIIGIDIGGTTTKIGVLRRSGEMLSKWEIPTHKNNKSETIVKEMWNYIDNKLQETKYKNKVIGIGVGAPGFVNEEIGLVYEAVNLGWRNFNLQDELNKLSGLPVFIENDANLALLGENWKGSGNCSENIILVTLGTGIGSGIIANGQVLSGANGTASELGHIIVDPNGYPCNCGRVGCLDTIASATGFVKQGLDSIAKHPDSTLAAHFQSKGELEAKDIFLLAKEGDHLCEKIVNHTSEILGYMIASTATLINPNKIVIGGGVSNAGEQLLDQVTKYFQKYALPRISECCEVSLAHLGNDAGIYGAAYLVNKKIDGSY